LALAGDNVLELYSQHQQPPAVGNNSIEEMNHHEKYLIDTNNIWNKPFLKFLNRYVCPCCNYPTLNERNSYEICGLCCWEDDGQDESNASKILGGPNQDYSLAEARYNFKQYLTMFRPSDTKSFERREKNKINEIKEIYDNILQMDTEKEKELIENELKKAKLLEDSLLK